MGGKIEWCFGSQGKRSTYSLLERAISTPMIIAINRGISNVIFKAFKSMMSLNMHSHAERGNELNPYLEVIAIITPRAIAIRIGISKAIIISPDLVLPS